MNRRLARLVAGSLLAATVCPAWAVDEPESAPIRFDITRFAVSGNTLLSPSEVDAAVAPFTGTQRDFSDVQRALDALEEVYRARGYQLVGDWDELRPDPVDDTAFADPDSAPDDQVADVALQSVVTLLGRATELRHEIEGLHRRIEVVEAERDQARSEIGFVLRKKRGFIRRADTSPTIGFLYRAYRKVLRRR